MKMKKSIRQKRETLEQSWRIFHAAMNTHRLRRDTIAKELSEFAPIKEEAFVQWLPTHRGSGDWKKFPKEVKYGRVYKVSYDPTFFEGVFRNAKWVVRVVPQTKYGNDSRTHRSFQWLPLSHVRRAKPAVNPNKSCY